MAPRRAQLRQPRLADMVASVLRERIVNGDLANGDLLPKQDELLEEFRISRPSLREALRILEAEGLITVVRGVLGGVIVHQPNERMTARTAALVLQARNVTLGDVHEARTMIEPAAVRVLASSPPRKAVDELRSLVEAQRAVLDDPEAFGQANARFHERLVALAGNQTLSIVAEMLNEIVARAVTAVSQSSRRNSLTTRQRGIRSQERLIELIAIGASIDAEAHWRAHMEAVGKVMIGQEAKSVIDLLDHY
jgi:DNA-binding FadR family transcriptional regulator